MMVSKTDRTHKATAKRHPNMVTSLSPIFKLIWRVKVGMSVKVIMLEPHGQR